jgi:hypothetical protein
VVESGHGSEVLNGNIGSVALADKSVGVSGVSNNDGLGISGAVVVDGLTNINKDLTVILEQIGTFHSGSSGLGSDEEVIVDFLEGGGEVASDNDIFEEGEGAIVEFSLDTLEDLFLEGEIKQVEDDALVFSQEFSAGNSVDNRVGNLSSSSRDENSLWWFTVGGERSLLSESGVDSFDRPEGLHGCPRANSATVLSVSTVPKGLVNP